MSSGNICMDNRFELIAKAREKLVDATNIEDRPEEMAVLDSILFRCWQMGWLDRLETSRAEETECIDTRCYGDPHGGEVYHIHVMECSACGQTFEHVNGAYEYCPHCRRRLVIE